MCTLTYLPWKDGFTFTHNRDERSDRPTSKNLISKEIGKHQVFYPKDLEANGTWFAFSNKGWAACLLNGGSEPHSFGQKYRHSRGLIPLAIFEHNSIESFYQKFNLNRIEPFTLLVRNEVNLYELVHNKNENLLAKKDIAKPHIWASTTLYSEKSRKDREVWFKNWLNETNEKDESKILEFHQTAGEGDSENDLVMSRGDFLKTTSIAQVSLRGNAIAADYRDLASGNRDVKKILLQK